MMPLKAGDVTHDIHYKFDIEAKIILQNTPNDIRRNIISGVAY
jgi:hypothetical protein